jgi:hypothetical protein|tara:strand:+ start:492 stop:812 length:321 start_codon:yes stop_codon:yes gene_type:complete
MSIGHLLTDTISIAAPSGVNDDGELTYATATTAQAKVQEKRDVASMGAGLDIETNHVIITKAAITKKHRIWLPGDSTSDATLARTPQVLEKANGIGSGETVYKVQL